MLRHREIWPKNNDAIQYCKEIRMNIVTLSLSACLFFTALVEVSAKELSAREIVRKVDAVERVQSSHSTGEQIITTSGGKKRTLEFEAFSKDANDKQLMVYTGPNRVKGDKILMLNDGDDIWFYTPKTDRVRHLASHARRQKVQGSDFSYEDLSTGNYEVDYAASLLGTEKILDTDCYKLEMIPTETGPHYTRIILWADQQKFTTVQCDYYEDNELLKRLTCHDIRNVDGHWYSMQMNMTNMQEGGETIILTKEISFDMELDERLFSTNHLKRR
jgi:outer membrane lipoprotein-sorting protein